MILHQKYKKQFFLIILDGIAIGIFYSNSIENQIIYGVLDFKPHFVNLKDEKTESASHASQTSPPRRSTTTLEIPVFILTLQSKHRCQEHRCQEHHCLVSFLLRHHLCRQQPSYYPPSSSSQTINEATILRQSSLFVFFNFYFFPLFSSKMLLSCQILIIVCLLVFS